MTKRPEIIAVANQRDLKFLEDFTDLPGLSGNEMCLDIDPDLFFSEFANDITVAKEACTSCPMIEMCAAYALKHENYGVWGGLSAEERFAQRGNKDAFDVNDLERLLNERNFILNSPASEVAKHYGVESRTVVRWRNTIRDAQKAS